MALYFFHVRDGDTLLKDDGEGQEFPNLEAVRLEALEGARDILSEAARSGHAGSLNKQIEVADEAGRTVVTMRVGRATGTESQT